MWRQRWQPRRTCAGSCDPVGRMSQFVVFLRLRSIRMDRMEQTNWRSCCPPTSSLKHFFRVNKTFPWLHRLHRPRRRHCSWYLNPLSLTQTKEWKHGDDYYLRKSNSSTSNSFRAVGRLRNGWFLLPRIWACDSRRRCRGQDGRHPVLATKNRRNTPTHISIFAGAEAENSIACMSAFFFIFFTKLFRTQHQSYCVVR